MALTDSFSKLSLSSPHLFPSEFSGPKSPDSGYHSCSPLLRQKAASNQPLSWPTSNVLHLPPTVLGTPAIGDPRDPKQTTRLEMHLDNEVPLEVLRYFWGVMPAKCGDSFDKMNHALYQMTKYPVNDYGWIVRTYWALLVLHDALWAQRLVSAAGRTPKVEPEERRQELVGTMQLIERTLLRLEEAANPFGTEPLACIKRSRVFSYPEDHPFRVIQQYLRIHAQK